MYTIRKKFRFEMAHRLDTSYTKACQNTHGHSYILEVYFRGYRLNDDGMLIDFKKVKDILRNYIDSWDHMLVLKNPFPRNKVPVAALKCEDVKLVKYNPTAENMSKDMFDFIKTKFPSLWKVRLHETETGYAEYCSDDK